MATQVIFTREVMEVFRRLGIKTIKTLVAKRSWPKT